MSTVKLDKVEDDILYISNVDTLLNMKGLNGFRENIIMILI